MNRGGKFNIDLLWNAGAFGLAALLGILVNFLIYKRAGEEYLGVFNQCYAGYILLSQLAVGGVHLSVQRFVPAYSNDAASLKNILSSALLLSMISSVLVILPAWWLSDFPGRWLHSKLVVEAFPMVLPGLFFFSINKVLLAFLNGLRVMKAFAVFQFLRFFFLLLFILYFLYDLNRPSQLAQTLAWSEATLFVFILFFFIPRYSLLPSSGGFKNWISVQNSFGLKALLGNFLLDVNTRVDVFILGIFQSDAVVGVYSYASTFAEGFLQITVLVRNNINPVLARLAAKNNADFSHRILQASVKKSYLQIGALGLICIAGFPLFLMLTQTEQAFQVWLVLALLVGFASLTAGYHPFMMIHNQFGQPGMHTWFILTLFLANIIFNLIFVPIMGGPGAAFATGLSYVIMMLWLRYVSPKWLGFSF
jgi:O-antigen/teichoic acid export membrane protein